MADADQTQNFSLPPLPPVLLVDDDQNNPNLQTYYTGRPRSDQCSVRRVGRGCRGGSFR